MFEYWVKWIVFEVECDWIKIPPSRAFYVFAFLLLFSFFQTYVNLKQYDHSLYANVNDLKAMWLYSWYWAEGSYHRLTSQPKFCLLLLLLLLLWVVVVVVVVVVVIQVIAWFLCDIWHKYHEWYFEIVVRNFTSR